MLSNAKKAWHIALAFVLATALSLPSLAFGLDGKGDTSSAADGTMNVYVEDQAGNTALMKSYTADEFAALAAEVDAGYQYGKNGNINLIAVNKMVTFDKLIADAGASAYWKAGAKLQFTCTDGVYKKNVPTYEDVAEQNLLYPNQTPTDENNTTDAVEVPAILAFTYGQANSDGATVLDAAKSAASAMKTHATAKVFRGWKADETGTIDAPGWRLATGVVNVNLQTTHAS